MQGDLSNNGPNNGDRLIDWNGVDNPWSHCNAAYGGFTDVRAPAPAVQDFLEKWGTGNGAGSTRHRGRRSRHGDRRDVCVRRAGPVSTGDLSAHGAGSAYPTTPGHFDDANACSGP
jgi:hypothetical protein